ncbi:hypothetical protein A9Q99_27035 [Gammaproteobacteria bacterium 45_16_T64]|nr:hypothetical protein A9Q99_27035 [Gammaproteobacteria bacterium 45_16_T64]
MAIGWASNRFFLFVGLLLSLLLAGGGVCAEPSKKTDMRVVIDISGSMKKTDPENLRIPAVKLMLNLAKDNSRFGVWTFGQYVNMLVPHKDVTLGWRQDAIKRSELINSVALYTNIGEALEKASLKQTTDDPEWDRTMVLLSDGMVDISKSPAVNEREQQRIFKEVVPKLRKAGFKIHSVALSKAADLSFLKKLAVETGGSFSLAKTADELLNIFVQASDKANVPEQVPLEGNVFDIDAAVQEFTALIYRKQGSPQTMLQDPSGKKLSRKHSGRGVNWFSDSRYDLITVRDPKAGQWRLIADVGKDNRVTVISDLSLVVGGLPDNMIEGERTTMKMYLSEDGRAIKDPDFLRLMDIVFSQKTEAGELFEGALSRTKKGKAVLPADGRYSAKLGRTLSAGMHEFTVMVDGKTFKRKRVRQMMVHTDVLAVEQEVVLSDDGEKTTEVLKITPKKALLNIDKLEILAQLKSSLGGKQVSKVEMDESGDWILESPTFDGEGAYSILIKVNGESVNGGPFELVQGPYSIGTATEKKEQPVEEAVDMADEEALFDDADIDVQIEDVVEEVVMPEPKAEPEEVVEEQQSENIAPAPEVEAPAESVVDAPEVAEELDIMMLGIMFMLSNVILLGGGFFVYKKMSKSEEESTHAVEEQLAKAKQLATDRDLERSFTAPMSPTVMEDEEATVMRTASVDDELDDKTVTQIQQQKPVSAEELEPQPSEEEDNAYVNNADPMELDDDEFIEIDDEFDELDIGLDEGDGLDELDVMLSEQEDEPEEDDDKKEPFVNDEFQLDSPEE